MATDLLVARIAALAKQYRQIGNERLRYAQAIGPLGSAVEANNHALIADIHFQHAEQLSALLADLARETPLETFAASQVDLPADAQKVLNDNAWTLYGGDPVPHVPIRETPESAERTLKSIAAMLGWENVPPRETLEREINALKSRAEHPPLPALGVEREAEDECGCRICAKHLQERLDERRELAALRSGGVAP